MKFTLVHASGNHFMPIKATVSDTQRLLRVGALIYTVTEVDNAHTVAAIKKTCHGHPYTLVNPDEGDIIFLVHDDATIIDTGGPVVIPAVHAPAAQGGHTARCNSYVAVHHQGETITHTGVHFVTAHPDHHHTVEQRRTQQVTQANLMGAQMRRFSVGTHLATGSGDLNASIPFNTDVQAAFDSHGLTTTRTETGNNDTTHNGAVLDYIWTTDRDSRVTVDSMRVLTGFNSDHRPVVAHLTVRPAKSP